MEKPFYITTAIDYVNAAPHLGHAYEKILADVLARWHRLKGEDVFFLTGTDENAQKNVQAAIVLKIPIKQFVDQNSKKFQELCNKLNISNDDFIRTTEERHIKVVKQIFKKISSNNDIYKGKYEGNYCYGCEAFLTDKELVEGKCPEHNKKPKWLREDVYFFKLSKYQDKVLRLISKKDFITPKNYQKEIISRVKLEGLKDLCVTRTNLDWGIKTPIDDKHVIYVWLDALINYISALDYPSEKFKKYWPESIHLIGKGINWFHSVIWPAILFSADIKPPKQIIVHGYVNLYGKKLSKSAGKIIDPIDLINKYGADSLRYYLIREIPFGEDGDFSEEILKSKINNELANDLGNLLSRVLTLVEKNFNGKLDKSNIDKKLKSKLELKKISDYIDKYELHNALSEIWKFVNNCNKHINEEKLWEMQGDKLQNHLYTLLESIRIIAILLSSFMPETSGKIYKQLGIKCNSLDECKFGLIKSYNIKKGEILFKKV